MAIALHSAALAVRSILQGETAETYHRHLARDITGQMTRANFLSAALNNAVTQPMMFAIAKLWPKTLQTAAELTRVPLHARL
jgi:flavin-dependent dehydrogenase